MWKTTVRRLIILIPQLIGVTMVVFILASFLPGDPLTGGWAGTEDGDDPLMQERIEELRERFGLNDPWPVRYGRWIGNMFRGDFGRSLVHFRPVTELMGERMPNTLLLSVMSVIIVYSFALPLGLIAGRYRGKLPEKVISSYNFIQMSFPVAAFAVLLLWFFAIYLRWLPLSGSVDVRVIASGSAFEIWVSRIRHALLPALAGSLLAGVGIIQFLGNEINEQKNQDYTTLARSKGVPMGHVYRKHIFRNAILPIVAGFGAVITGLFGGAVIIENIFIYNGMGRLFIEALGTNDWAVVNFLVLFYAALTIIGVLISDISLTVFDPRIRIK